MVSAYNSKYNNGNCAVKKLEKRTIRSRRSPRVSEIASGSNRSEEDASYLRDRALDGRRRVHLRRTVRAQAATPPEPPRLSGLTCLVRIYAAKPIRKRHAKLSRLNSLTDIAMRTPVPTPPTAD